MTKENTTKKINPLKGYVTITIIDCDTDEVITTEIVKKEKLEEARANGESLTVAGITLIEHGDSTIEEEGIISKAIDVPIVTAKAAVTGVKKGFSAIGHMLTSVRDSISEAADEYDEKRREAKVSKKKATQS